MPREVDLTPNLDSDKRRYLRYELLDCARVSATEDEPFQSIVVDIGLGGLQMRARHEVDPGESLKILVGRTNEEPLELAGEVRHCVALNGSGLKSIGVRFTPRNHDERLAIAEYVHGIFQRQCDLLTG